MREVRKIVSGPAEEQQDVRNFFENDDAFVTVNRSARG